MYFTTVMCLDTTCNHICIDHGIIFSNEFNFIHQEYCTAISKYSFDMNDLNKKCHECNDHLDMCSGNDHYPVIGYVTKEGLLCSINYYRELNKKIPYTYTHDFNKWQAPFIEGLYLHIIWKDNKSTIRVSDKKSKIAIKNKIFIR